MSKTLVSRYRDLFKNFETKLTGIEKIEVTKRVAELVDPYDYSPVRLRQSVDGDFVRIYKSKETGDSIGFSFREGYPDDFGVNQELIIVSIHEGAKRFYKTFGPESFKDCLKNLSRQLQANTDIENMISSVKDVFDIRKAEKEVSVFDKDLVLSLIDSETKDERREIDNAETLLRLKNIELSALEKRVADEVKQFRRELELKYGVDEAIAARDEAGKLLDSTQDLFLQKVSSFYKNFDISIEKFLFEAARYFRTKRLHSDALNRAIGKNP